MFHSIVGNNSNGNDEVQESGRHDAPFSALAFKIMADPFVGKLAFFRVYSGTLKTGSYVLQLDQGQTRADRKRILLQMHANASEEIDAVYAGDIAAAVGFKQVTTGDTLCDDKRQIILEKMEFPEPVIEVAIEPKTKRARKR